MQTLDQIKHLRKKHFFNQKELAEKAAVSQSLIAKIESGKIEPSFSNAKKIFTVLEELREKQEIKANQLMNRKIVFAKTNDKVKDLIHILKRKSINTNMNMNDITSGSGPVHLVCLDMKLLKEVYPLNEKINADTRPKALKNSDKKPFLKPM